jgi:hypothetical protein
VRKSDNLTNILCHCHEIWEPSGLLQACNGTALPLPYRQTQLRLSYNKQYPVNTQLHVPAQAIIRLYIEWEIKYAIIALKTIYNNILYKVR